MGISNCGRIKEVALALLLVWSVVCTGSGHGGSKPHNNIRCHQEERDALLQIKQELNDCANPLGSWNVGTRPDCCKWRGVTCHNLTGYVLVLDVSSGLCDGKLSPAVLELKHLRHLDYSNNEFNDTRIPAFLGSMRGLRYLSLPEHSGEIPGQLGNLSKLEYLRVVGSGGEDMLRSGNLEWLQGMPNLKHLEMQQVIFSNTAHFWEHAANNFSFLVQLHLIDCTFPGPLPLLNFTALRVLQLTSNSLSSNIPTGIANMSNLESLDLSSNHFHGPLPLGLSKLPRLKFLDLSGNWMIVGNCSDIFATGWTSIRKMDFSYNQLNGEIPGSIGNLSSLVELHLPSNAVQGVIPDSIGHLTSLRKLDLSGNRLGGKIPNTICNLQNLQELTMRDNLLEELPQCPQGSHLKKRATMRNLEYLALSSNNLHGTIPSWLGGLSSLSYLSLEQNQLNGTVPTSLSRLSKLETLTLANNQLSGALNETHFAQLANLTFLDLSSNQLGVHIRNDNWEPPFQLSTLYLESCHVGPHFPRWLMTQQSLLKLDLSNTSLDGTFPISFWQWASGLLNLNLAHNQIEGQLPDLSSTRLEDINLSYNKFSGIIPPGFIAYMMDVSGNNLSGPVPHFNQFVKAFLARNNQLNGTIPVALCQSTVILGLLDLSQNQISGKIPANLGNCSSLERLFLSDNHLVEGIPKSIGNLAQLTSLHLKNNFLPGKLPVSLGNCSSLEILDIGDNHMSGSILPIMNNTRMNILSLHKNLFSGEIPFNVSRMSQLQIFDVSLNEFSGRIPPIQGMVKSGIDLTSYPTGLDEKQYYNEKLSLLVKGAENEYSSILHLVTCIDLSSNHFDGEIPQELMNLSGLMFLNMSHNRLTGKIPSNVGELINLESLDLSNNQLAGEIPPSLSRISTLAKLNFSGNKLQGRVPTGPQLDTFNSSSYANNLGLCGPPLDKPCPQDTPVLLPLFHGKSNIESAIIFTWVYLGMLSGFAVGFWGVVGTLVLRRDFRFAFFNFLDALVDKFVTAMLRRWTIILLIKNRGNE